MNYIGKCPVFFSKVVEGEEEDGEEKEEEAEGEEEEEEKEGEDIRKKR